MILVVSKSKENSSALSDMFYHMGVLSSVCDVGEMPYENLSFFGAVIFLAPDTLSGTNEAIATIRKHNKEALCVAVGGWVDVDLDFDILIEGGTYASRIYEIICAEAEKKNISSPGRYRLGEFYADADSACSGYKKALLPFSKTENMILRALIRAYPTPLSSKELLSYAFKSSRLPEISNVRTHVCIMNKKFRSVTKHPLVELITSRGYVIAKENTN